MPHRAMLCALVLLLGPHAHGEALASEVKAAYIYNFARFVQWPASAFENPDSPLHVCLYGVNGHPHAFMEMAGKQAAGRALEVRQLNTLEPATHCHILFIDQRQLPSSRGLPPFAQGATLTISDAPWFSRQGGVISLYTQRRRVKFRVNQYAAQQAGLSVSARLLRLAEEVYE